VLGLADSTKLAAEMRRWDAASIAFAQVIASGSSRRIAISAEPSMIVTASRAHHALQMGLAERRRATSGRGAAPLPVAAVEMAGEAYPFVATATEANTGAKALRRFRLLFG
jgi:hypothetical protein